MRELNINYINVRNDSVLLPALIICIDFQMSRLPRMFQNLRNV